MKKRTVNKKIILAVFVFLFIAVTSLNFYLPSVYSLTQNDVKDYSAVIDRVSIDGTGEIFTDEFSLPLYISSGVIKKIGTQKINDLKNGEKIYFEAEKDARTDNEVSIYIVSLKTDDEIIFSLNDYNEALKESAKPAKIAGIILDILCIAVIILISYKLIKEKTA